MSCVCDNTNYPFWCEACNLFMSEGLHTLCKTRPEYSEKFQGTKTVRPSRRNQYPVEKPYKTNGVGTQMEKWFSALLLHDDGTCGCKNYARKMDRNGIPWCDAHREEILLHLQQSARKKKIPFAKYAAAMLLGVCISTARHKQSKTITIGVTTYMRPESLKRCLDSIEKFYAQFPVIVQDTGGNLSWGRNQIANQCKTPYLIIMEDDMEFTEYTNLTALESVLNADDTLIGCAGEMAGRANWANDWKPFRGRLDTLPSSRPIRVTPDGVAYRPCEVTHNFALFRTAQLKEFPWHESLELNEHYSWYWSFREKWLMGYTRACKVNHHYDRPEEYVKVRNRARDFRAKSNALTGYEQGTAPPKIEPGVNLPSIVVLGVGHSNTTITTRQIAELGWKLGDADEQFAESVSVRKANTDLLAGQEIPQMTFRKALQRESPWVIKDPRFAKGTLPFWLPEFSRQSIPPFLLWITKDMDQVRASYERRGQMVNQLEEWLANCARYFDEWPWGKLKVSAESILRLGSMLDYGTLPSFSEGPQSWQSP